jgi:broad specificity phosphatase PhoE/predicted kinase
MDPLRALKGSNMSLTLRGRKYVLVMVGLPARGKSYTARKLRGYLSWLGYASRVFNVGERRREVLGAGASHDFFDPGNQTARDQREALGLETLHELLDWLKAGGRVGIYDATNSTRERRALVRRECAAAGVEVLFISIMSNDPSVIEENIRGVKLDSPDYLGVDAETALADFRKRLAHYESVYEPLEADEGAFIRVVDRGRQVLLNAVDGYLPARIVFFLSNLQVTRREIWLTRHGESQFNVAGRVGGDSPLSPRGCEYASNLAAAVHEHFTPEDELNVWTSTLQRTIETAAPIGMPTGPWRALDEIDAGVCDGLSYDEIRAGRPEEWEARKRDKLRYRYPRGESYEDVIQRVDRVIIELERYRTPVLVVAHRAVLRALYAYFVQLPLDEVPHAPIPLHTIMQLSPSAYGCEERRLQLPPLAEQDQ